MALHKEEQPHLELEEEGGGTEARERENSTYR
jgi:hypothetical protein